MTVLALQVEQLTRLYTGMHGKTAGGVQVATFDIAEGELFTLLGPSGCGKTTTLRAVAGLETPNAGRIAIAGREVFNGRTGKNIALHNRELGMVFQSYAIWPHMSVFENAAYPLRVSRTLRYSQSEITKKTTGVLERVGLGAFASRPATQLSGGQQQRLALARALAREPRLLLLDEPLSNLDAQLREQMRVELKRLQQETGVTAVYVTHDQTEALAISDRIAVMHEGRIAQIGKPKDIYNRPNSEFVANFVGRSNLFHGVAARATKPEEIGLANTALGDITCLFPDTLAQGTNVAVLVRPENIRIAKSGNAHIGESGENRLTGKVLREIYLGETVEYLTSVNGTEILVRAPSAGVAPGDEVNLFFSARHSIAIPQRRPLDSAIQN
jgi:iron(III) transport system ATP-binding protein